MTGTVTLCDCKLPKCGHPRTAGMEDHPSCNNQRYGNEVYCEFCRDNRPAAKVAAAEEKLAAEETD
jgi:hypothetical protein